MAFSRVNTEAIPFPDRLCRSRITNAHSLGHWNEPGWKCKFLSTDHLCLISAREPPVRVFYRIASIHLPHLRVA